MKLSEILGWEKLDYKHLLDEGYAKPIVLKNSVKLKRDLLNIRNEQVSGYEGYNSALTSCDREIDREALAEALYEKETDNFWRDLKDPYKEIYFMRADYIISTMPTWLKRIEK